MLTSEAGLMKSCIVQLVQRSLAGSARPNLTTFGLRIMKPLEKTFQDAKQKVWLVLGLNFLSLCLLGVFFWLLWSGTVKLPAIAQPFLLAYIGIFGAIACVSFPVQSLIVMKELYETQALIKKAKHQEDWHARMIPAPFVPISGFSICWLGRKDENGNLLEDSQQYGIAVSSSSKGSLSLSEIIKGKPTCEYPALEVKASLDGKKRPRIIQNDADIYVIVQYCPKMFSRVINELEGALYGKDRSSKW